METQRNTHQEEIIELEYKLKQFTTLLHLVGKEIGLDKVIEIAKSSDYPKTDEQIVEMIEQGRLIKDLDRYEFEIAVDRHEEGTVIEDNKSKLGEWVKWSDIEYVIK